MTARPAEPIATAITLAFYFTLTGGGALAAWYGLDRGAPLGVVVFGVVAIAVGIILVGERVRPYRRGWMRSHGDVQTDVLHMVFSTGIVLGGRGVATFVFAGQSTWLEPAALWPTKWPLVLQLLLALAVEELGGYWIHRAQHHVPWLWRFHAVHHSAPRVYWLNQVRNHPADALISGLAILPLVVLGAPENTLGIFVVATSIHTWLQHANIDLRFGTFNWILSSPEVHRWHHSRELHESNANYGGVILAWDVLFGTRRFPLDQEPPEQTGLAGDLAGFPRDYFGQLAAPFRSALWRRR
jgi:sterol desaturase/sphingolipid hydroxylase (fatty acid hydroxylase superfamily)